MFPCDSDFNCKAMYHLHVNNVIELIKLLFIKLVATRKANYVEETRQLHYSYHISRNIDSNFVLIWHFANRAKMAKLTYTIIDPFMLQAWVFLHTLMKSTNLKSCQQRFLSKPPNIMLILLLIW